MRQRSRSVRLAALAFVALAAACSSTSKKDDDRIPKLIDKPEPDSIGKFLADTDSSIMRWSSLTMTARTSADQREARLLEAVLVDSTTKRIDELIEQLETGPPINRIRAAAALGFTRLVEAQSPLLAALSDRTPDVIHNALFGLAVLGRGDTPLEPICEQLERSPDGQTRGQAAWALRSIVGAGGTSPATLPAARRGLADSEPLVRTQCALVLGLLGDSESVRALGDLLYDPVPLVGEAVGEALVRIVDHDVSQKGPVGRRLVEVLDKGTNAQQKRAKEALVRLSDVNYGDDLKLWIEWAQRLP